MSEQSFGPDDPLSRDQVATAVAAACPGWELESADPIPEGSDVVYRVTAVDPSDGERRAVLKCLRQSGPLTGRSDARFLTEPRLFELAGAETSVPVPEVYGVCRDHPDVPTPLFLVSHEPGINAEPISVADRPAVGERIARESGRYLAAIHELRSFDGYGEVRAAGVESGEWSTGVESGDRSSADREFVLADGGHDEWVGHLYGIRNYVLDNIGETRFVDLEGRLREGTERYLERLAALPDPESVLFHGDYRHGNLLVDADSGEIQAVLDWGAPVAGDRLSELVTVGIDLADRAPPDSAVGERVRTALFDAYEDERGVAFERDEAFAFRRRCYRFLSECVELRWFPYWYEDATDAAREERAAQLRESVEAALADGPDGT